MILDSKTYVKNAEEVIKSLNKPDERGKITVITSSQIRNLLILVNELYSMIELDKSEKLSDEIISHAQYVKMKIAYNAGREPSVKSFVKNSHIMEYIDGIGDSRNNLMLVCHYMEALVAYHKYIINN